MIENLEFEEFYKAVRAVINDHTSEELEEGYPVDRFTKYFINQLSDFGVTSDAEVFSFEKNLGAADVISNGWFLDQDEGRLSLFVTCFNDSDDVKAVGKQEFEKSIKRAARVYDFAKKVELSKLEQSSAEYTMVRTIRDAIDDINQLRIIFLTDGELKKTGDSETSIGDMPVYVSYWDIQRLYRLVSSGREYEAIEIDFEHKFGQRINCLAMPANSDEYQGYLAIIPGDMLASLYSEYGARLMELNVRSFLQQRGKVNRGIRETILNEPHRFLAYNNGISATAEDIVCERTEDGDLAIKQIKGLQIVNGGQTVASINRASKIDRCQHLDQLSVQAKITVVKPDLLEELVPKISRYSNTQNTVNEADFASNDPFHIELEKLANSTWAPGQQSRWFYERARGQYEVARNRVAGASAVKRRRFDEQTPKNQKFAKTELAKYFDCWEQKPHIVSLGAQKNFVQCMKYLSGFTPDETFYKELIAKAVIYKTAEKIARKHKFPSYRANAVAYTIALIAFKTVGRVNLQAFWTMQAVSSAFYDVLDEWMPIVWEKIVQSAGERNVTEWAKKAECWAEVQLLDLSVSDAFEDELRDGDPLPTVGHAARTGKAAEISTIDRNNINRVLQNGGEVWRKIALWGHKTNEIPVFQVGIAQTLSNYADLGWEKIPSVKQVKHAVAALDAAQEAGILDLSAREAGTVRLVSF